MKPLLMLTFCCVLLCPALSSAQTVVELAAAREKARAASAAYHARDWHTTSVRLTEALEVQPHHPIWLYNLACAAALRGDTARALMLLDTLAALGFGFDAHNDTDFDALRASKGFHARTAALEANRTRIGWSVPAAALRNPAFLPEGIAYDEARRAIYISSVHERKFVLIVDGVTTKLAV
jgi:hypothetical protein